MKKYFYNIFIYFFTEEEKRMRQYYQERKQKLPEYIRSYCLTHKK